MRINYESEFSYPADTDMETVAGLMGQFIEGLYEGLSEAVSKTDFEGVDEIVVRFQFGCRTLEADADGFLNNTSEVQSQEKQGL